MLSAQIQFPSDCCSFQKMSEFRLHTVSPPWLKNKKTSRIRIPSCRCRGGHVTHRATQLRCCASNGVWCFRRILKVSCDFRTWKESRNQMKLHGFWKSSCHKWNDENLVPKTISKSNSSSDIEWRNQIEFEKLNLRGFETSCCRFSKSVRQFFGNWNHFPTFRKRRWKSLGIYK